MTKKEAREYAENPENWISFDSCLMCDVLELAYMDKHWVKFVSTHVRFPFQWEIKNGAPEHVYERHEVGVYEYDELHNAIRDRTTVPQIADEIWRLSKEARNEAQAS